MQTFEKVMLGLIILVAVIFGGVVLIQKAKTTPGLTTESITEAEKPLTASEPVTQIAPVQTNEIASASSLNTQPNTVDSEYPKTYTNQKFGLTFKHKTAYVLPFIERGSSAEGSAMIILNTAPFPADRNQAVSEARLATNQTLSFIINSDDAGRFDQPASWEDLVTRSFQVNGFSCKEYLIPEEETGGEYIQIGCLSGKTSFSYFYNKNAVRLIDINSVTFKKP